MDTPVDNTESVTDVNALIKELFDAGEVIRIAEERRESAIGRLKAIQAQITEALSSKDDRLGTISIESMMAETGTHVLKCLKEAGIMYIGQLTKLSEMEVQQIPNLGATGFPLIKKALTDRGLTLSPPKNGASK